MFLSEGHRPCAPCAPTRVRTRVCGRHAFWDTLVGRMFLSEGRTAQTHCWGGVWRGSCIVFWDTVCR